jgi:peptide/nickel transport system permease protein
MIQGGVLVAAIGFVFVNFVVDVIYTVLDPRIRHGAA